MKKQKVSCNFVMMQFAHVIMAITAIAFYAKLGAGAALLWIGICFAAESIMGVIFAISFIAAIHLNEIEVVFPEQE